MLAAARSLVRREVSVVVVGVGPGGMVGASRYVRPYVVGRGPDPGLEPEAYAAFVLDVARRYDVRLILPLTDKTLLACDRHREALEARAPLGAPPSPAVRNVLDKRLNLETARRLGIPCPEQFELESLEHVPELIDRLGFPMVLKDPGPSADGERPEFDFAWLVARDEHELDRYLAERCPPGSFPLFQRLVTGTVRNLCCFAAEGEIAAVHEYRGIRRLRGNTAFREITPLTPDLRRYAELMLCDLRWDGVAHLGFFVRESDGDARYMETNGRFWASLPASIAAGWDFPYWTYRYFVAGEIPQPPPPSLGVGRKSRWHYGDLEGLFEYLSGSAEPSRVGRSRAQAVFDYLAGFRRGIDADVFRLDDPLPELVEHWRGGRLALRRARRRIWRRRTR